MRLGQDATQLFGINYPRINDRLNSMVVHYLRTRIQQLKSGETFRVVAHSQGTAVFAEAASYLTSAERARIDFTAYGEAIPAFPSGLHSVTRFINVLDLVPMSLGGGILTSARSGDDVYYMRFVHGGAHPIAAYLQEQENAATGRASIVSAAEARRRGLQTIGQITTIMGVH